MPWSNLFTRVSLSIIEYAIALFLKWKNHLVKPAEPHQHIVWLMDNTAYQHTSPVASKQQRSWHVEVIACVFVANSRKSTCESVATIADLIGLDGQVGNGDAETLDRIKQRLYPFLAPVAPGRLIKLGIPIPNGPLRTREIGPTNSNGICSQGVRIGIHSLEDGTVIQSYLRGWGDAVSMNTRFAAPEGWLIISDIDDTIKHTQTPDFASVLRTTFAEEPRPVLGMPQLYSHIHSKLAPTWFYVSASPYNLYPFLRGFIQDHYCPGTIILRAYSVDLNGLYESLTKNTEEFKSSRIEKIHEWLPRRRVICIGDSAQSDPEAYANMYRKYPGWIKGIFIRKVAGVSNLEQKNAPERFDTAFSNIPNDVWKLFEEPDELHELVNDLKARDR